MENNFIKSEAPSIKARRFKRDDCTVNSVAHTFGISYDLALAALRHVYEVDSTSCVREKARPKCEFMESSKFYKFLSDLGGEVDKSSMGMTVAAFARKHTRGDYLVLTDSHALSVKNGVILDGWDPRGKWVESAIDFSDKGKALGVLKEVARLKNLDLEEHILYRDTESQLIKLREAQREMEKVHTLRDELNAGGTYKGAIVRLGGGDLVVLTSIVPRGRKFTHFGHLVNESTMKSDFKTTYRISPYSAEFIGYYEGELPTRKANLIGK